MTAELLTGSVSLVMTLAGITLAQVDPSMGGAIVGLVTQFGGLGLAVWLVYQHTTVTIPSLQREHREERQAALLQFQEQIQAQRAEYLCSLKELTAEYTTELQQRRLELLGAIKENGCKAPPKQQ